MRAENWNNWRWQVRNRIRTPQQLWGFLPQAKNVTQIINVTQKYPMAITPYYASLIKSADNSDPIFQMCVPQMQELLDPTCLSEDPLAENQDMPVPGMVHRYRDRVLLIATTACAMYCRHCTRKRIAGVRETSISPKRLEQVIQYLKANPQVSDVIISGGDPLTMSTESLETVLKAVRSVESVQIIRIGTRTPVVLPMRITDELIQMLKKYHPLWINTHFNHPNELTEHACRACAKLADAGIPLGNQTVLLKGINNDPKIIEQLNRMLVRNRVRPYYLYQCDLVKGVEHFRTSIRKGIEIMEYLRGRISGLAIPSFVVDAPHGGGKIPVMPNYVVSMSQSHTVLRNFEGMLINYPEPGIETQTAKTDGPNQAGVWELATGKVSAIIPCGNRRAGRTKNSQKTPETICSRELFAH
ncbi:MAG: KamA family radical SAM protein [Phycisphaerae bacterium]